MTHLFVLEQAGYTYNNAVALNTEQPTRLPVICSLPDSLWKNYRTKNSLKPNLFHYVLCLERSERNGYNNEDVTSEVEINGVKGDAWEDKDTCLIIWIHYEHQFSLYSSTLTLDEMLKIAESVKYLKIK